MKKNYFHLSLINKCQVREIRLACWACWVKNMMFLCTIQHSALLVQSPFPGCGFQIFLQSPITNWPPKNNFFQLTSPAMSCMFPPKKLPLCWFQHQKSRRNIPHPPALRITPCSPSCGISAAATKAVEAQTFCGCRQTWRDQCDMMF